jgi:hypothetical protein
VREADRPLPLRVSVLDQVLTDADALPEPLGAGPMMQEVDVSSVRLAFSDEHHRVYVGLAGPGDNLFLWLESTFGGGCGIGPRETLMTHGARVQSSVRNEGLRDEEREVVGIVSDEVTAVRVGGTEAVLANNVFVATGASYDDPIVVMTADGERAVRRPKPPPGDA